MSEKVENQTPDKAERPRYETSADSGDEREGHSQYLPDHPVDGYLVGGPDLLIGSAGR